MTGKRSYGEGCAASHALDLIGERWGLLIVRELLLGPKRFTDLGSALPSASSNILVIRLRELEQFGIIQRRMLPRPAASMVYELTAWGHALQPVLVELGRWASTSPFLDQSIPLGTDSLMLAMRTLFDADAAGTWSASFTVKLEDDVFRVRIADGELDIRRGEAGQPDAVIETDAATLDGIIWGGDALSGAKVTGSSTAVRKFVKLFPIPHRRTADVT